MDWIAETFNTLKELSSKQYRQPEPHRMEIGSPIEIEWPGEGYTIMEVHDIRVDKDGIECVVFGKDGTVGVDAVADFRYNSGRMLWEHLSMYRH